MLVRRQTLEAAGGLAGIRGALIDDCALAALIGRVAEELGTGVLLIEHNVGLVLSVSHHVYVLDAGQVIEEGDVDVILASQAVRDAYLGAEHAEQMGAS